MKYLANSPNNLEAEVTEADSKETIKNACYETQNNLEETIASSIDTTISISHESDVVLDNTAIKTPKLPTTLGQCKTISDVCFFLSRLGLSVIPIMTAKSAREYPQLDKKKKPIINKVTGEVKPLFDGKTPGTYDKSGKPKILAWRQYQNSTADQATLISWFNSGELNIGCLGTDYFKWLDLDAKNYSSVDECEKAFYSWYDNLTIKCNYGRTPNGGFRMPIKFKEYTTGYKFSFSSDDKPVGELIGRGHYAVIAPSVGANGKAYTVENDLPILEVKNPEEIGIHLFNHDDDSEEIERDNNPTSEDALDLLKLVSKHNLEIYNGSSPSGDASADITSLIRDAYGCANWLNNNGLNYSNDLLELVQECGANLGIDSDRVERILESVKDKDSCDPAILSAGTDVDCWKKVKTLLPYSVFSSKCPKDILKSLRNENRNRKKEAPLESEVVEALVELYKTELAWDGTYKRNLIYQGDSTKPNFGIYQEIQEEEVDRIIFAYLDSNNYAYKGAYPYNVKKYLKSKLWVKEFYSSHFNKLPLIGGVLNLSTMALEPHCQANRFDFCLPYKWIDKSLGCQPILDWLLWVCEGDELKRELLLAWMHCIVLNKVEYQKFLILTGAGGSGKGTFIRLCTALIGAANTADTTLPAMETNKFETATYIGKKLITVNEVENFSGSLTVLKNITGQDNIRFEEKYKQGGSAPIPALLMIAANHDINSSENSSAIFRRRIALEFNRVVSDGEKRNLISFNTHRLPTGDFVPYLAGLLEYVLAMNPERVKQLITQTSLYVPSLKKTAMEVTANSSPLAEWANYNLVLRTGAKTNVGCLKTPSSDVTMRTTYANLNNWLYPHYVSFCEAHNYKPLSTVKFSHNLNDLLVNQLKLDVTKDKDRTGAFFKGIAIRTDKDTDTLLLTGDCEPSNLSVSKSFLEKILALPYSLDDGTEDISFSYPELADIED